jgi:hypothetical protein
LVRVLGKVRFLLEARFPNRIIKRKIDDTLCFKKAESITKTSCFSISFSSFEYTVFLSYPTGLLRVHLSAVRLYFTDKKSKFSFFSSTELATVAYHLDLGQEIAFSGVNSEEIVF